MTVSYYAKMIMQAFKDAYGNDIKAGVSMPVDILNTIPQSERHEILNELVNKLEFIEIIETKFPGKLFLTHQGYHYIQKIQE